MTAVETAASPVRDLPAAKRNLDPWMHIDPCYVNTATSTKVFGYYFKEFYLSRTIKENTEYARIFNDHMLVTFAMDACRDRAVGSLGEVLRDPVPGDMFCSIERFEGIRAMGDARRLRNRVLPPWRYARDVFVDFNPEDFLSERERAEQDGPIRMAVMGQIDVVRPELVSATPFVLGTPTFTHFRNDGEALDLADFAPDWFESWPEDIDELAGAADVEAPPDAVWRAALAHAGPDAVFDALREVLGGEAIAGAPGTPARIFACGAHRGGEQAPCAVLTLAAAGAGPLGPDALIADDGALAALSASPAELWIVQHGQRISPLARETVRGFAVRPHAPRRFCLIDGADTWRILTACGRI